MRDLTPLIIFAASALFFSRRALRYLRFLQQQEYKNGRYLAWVGGHRAFDKRGSLVAAIAAGLLCFIPANPILTAQLSLIAAIGLWVIAVREEDPRVAGKLTLKMTERATRIFRASLALYFVVLAAFLTLFSSVRPEILWLSQLFFFQSIPVWPVIANLILDPYEKSIQAKFLDEARRNFARVAPFVIGITGSYGKTSTKDILGNMLQTCAGPTFWPPKSFNSLMGITRELRERLRPGMKYAVIEMGAYGIGSIKRLCDLTPPRAAIVTAVGIMHLERFGSEENVFTAKSELAQAVPQDGILVCNGDNPGARRIAQENPKQTTLLYGLHPDRGALDCCARDVRFSAEGTTFSVEWKGKRYSGSTRLLGEPALSNILGAFTMACALGGDPEYALGVARILEPVDNRLSVEKDGNVTFLKDAYNSNPTGFGAALDVLKQVPGSRKILITPGMVELGTRQDEENKRIAEHAAKVCNLVIVVGETNREALRSGLQAGGLAPEKIVIAENRERGFQALAAQRADGDVILIENDLPDLYEMNVKF